MVMFAKTSGQGYKIYRNCIAICFRNCIQLILGRTCTKRSLLFPDQSSCDDPRIPKASHAQRARKWPLEYNLNDLSILTADIFFPRIPLRKQPTKNMIAIMSEAVVWRQKNICIFMQKMTSHFSKSCHQELQVFITRSPGFKLKDAKGKTNIIHALKSAQILAYTFSTKQNLPKGLSNNNALQKFELKQK